VQFLELTEEANGLRQPLRSEGTSIPATGRSNTRVTMLYARRTSDAPTKFNWQAYAACAEGVDAHGVQFHGK
jgi:hypothetical protein